MQLVRPINFFDSILMGNLNQSTELFNIEKIFPSDGKSQNIFSSNWS